MNKFLRCSLITISILTNIFSHAQIDSNLFRKVIVTRTRVIIDNDFGGDPDGLFALAHHLLSPSVEIKAIIGSKQYDGGFYGYPGSATHASKMAKELLVAMKLEKKYNVLEGSNSGLKDTLTPAVSEGAKAIVYEAMKEDKGPLYIVCGAGLTNIASAFLMEPRIAKRIILVWIGGTEYEGLAIPPPGADKKWEYNTGIDVKAVQVIFNQSNIPIWQIPRNAYRQCLTSYAELKNKLKLAGKTGSYLLGRLEDLMKRADKKLGEAYVLGDSPLVLLTALQSSWEVDPSSSEYVLKECPRVNEKGVFETKGVGRKIRVYDYIDTRLMFEDFFAKLSLAGSKK